jgi:hypothetical protein
MERRRTRLSRLRWIADRHGAINDGGRNMPRISREILTRGIFGAIAVTLTSGAVQFASGRDLTRVSQSLISSAGVSSRSLAVSAEATINREAKADRASSAAGSASSQTISLRLDRLFETSVLVRVPIAPQARRNSSGPFLTKSGSGKLAVACESVVSMLTEVAKQLEPGRCVT